MQHDAVIATTKALVLSTAGTAASIASVGVQLNQPHLFLYMQLPLWFFLISMVVLSFLGAFLALLTDYMKGTGSKVGKFFTAFTVGIVLSFVILPTFVESPSVGWLQITAFFGAFSGTILLYILIRLLTNEELHNAVVDLLGDSIVNALKGMRKRVFGGDK